MVPPKFAYLPTAFPTSILHRASLWVSFSAIPRLVAQPGCIVLPIPYSVCTIVSFVRRRSGSVSFMMTSCINQKSNGAYPFCLLGTPFEESQPTVKSYCRIFVYLRPRVPPSFGVTSLPNFRPSMQLLTDSFVNMVTTDG